MLQIMRLRSHFHLIVSVDPMITDLDKRRLRYLSQNNAENGLKKMNLMSPILSSPLGKSGKNVIDLGLKRNIFQFNDNAIVKAFENGFLNSKIKLRKKIRDGDSFKIRSTDQAIKDVLEYTVKTNKHLIADEIKQLENFVSPS